MIVIYANSFVHYKGSLLHNRVDEQVVTGADHSK